MRKFLVILSKLSILVAFLIFPNLLLSDHSVKAQTALSWLPSEVVFDSPFIGQEDSGEITFKNSLDREVSFRNFTLSELVHDQKIKIGTFAEDTLATNGKFNLVIENLTSGAFNVPAKSEAKLKYKSGLGDKLTQNHKFILSLAEGTSPVLSGETEIVFLVNDLRPSPDAIDLETIQQTSGTTTTNNPLEGLGSLLGSLVALLGLIFVIIVLLFLSDGPKK